MDDYLSDKEQLERLRQWWRENGWFLLGGVAIGLLGLYGYRQYFAYQDRQSEAAASMYVSVRQAAEDNDPTVAQTVFAEMRNEFPDHVYTHQAALLLASSEIVTAPDDAIEKLRYTMENTSDPDLSMIARLRLARVLAYRERYAEALALLDIPNKGQFAGRIAEIKGDIHVALGETDAARSAYLEALVTPGAELLDRGFLQMKLADLPGAATDTPATSAPAAAPPSTETPAEASPADSAEPAPTADDPAEEGA